MKSTVTISLAAAIAAVGMCQRLSAAELMLVENGEPRAAIVVATDEPKAEKAAAEIQKYLAKMSGATLPLVKEGEPVDAAVSILVGHTKAAATLPLEMKFIRDRFNEGVIGEWYATDFDDANWGTKNTFFTWDQQDEPEDAAGHDYDGYGWYRAVIDVPKSAAGKTVKFWSGGMINEGWVWVNGQYIGHKPHAIWWMGPHAHEFDVTGAIRPGRNTIAIRVWNDAEIGGLLGRGFFWTPNEGEK